MNALEDLVGRSYNIVALTGAGLSTAAGIPDFRGPQGFYVTRQYDPEKTFELRWFNKDPRHFYRFAADFVDLLALKVHVISCLVMRPAHEGPDRA